MGFRAEICRARYRQRRDECHHAGFIFERADGAEDGERNVL